MTVLDIDRGRKMSAAKGEEPSPQIDPDDDGPLYAARKKIYPKAVKGHYRRIKWTLLIVTLAIYYLTPFIRWDRGPNAPDQAVLLDLPARRFYFFFIEIWPQEIYYVTGLLILAALTLFLMNAIAGRIWCGYLCPQTVWTDLFFAVERLIEGDQREQIKLKSGGWTLERFTKSLLKHSSWLLIAWWTGGAWVLYFADAPTLVYELATFSAPPVAYIWIAILTFTTYVFAGHMREQVCVYMCPWPRIQAALTDEHALNVTYRHDRGEPRASVKKAAALKAAGEPAGDCVDCNQCVAVCPTGIDIRNGSQLECIQCGLCIDACDGVMSKLGRETRLIAFDNEVNIKRREQGLPTKVRYVRPRTIVYAAAISIVGIVMLVALGMRTTIGINVIHDRNPTFVRLGDGGVRNAYTVRLTNKTLEPKQFSLKIDGIAAPSIEIIGSEAGKPLEVGPDQTRELRVLVSVRDNPVSAEVKFIIDDGKLTAFARDTFKAP